MKPEFENIPVVKNEEAKQFQLTVEGYTAFIDYKERNQVISLIHTESPEELAGRGAATALIEKVLTYLKENAYELVPLCPLVFAYIKRHPEWVSIVREDYKQKFI
ncbi:GNAT family N-acetyltransferase [Sphingobacterium bovistauri]|uniref:N-acetyltransferase n=1 Tax=Sphingobacterium bovistauri TaxID=2781959 RepID=A0ABS7Z2L4_9SPHI|nr:GNAT family N-acetyltransferase [Sphingobacterium bovistauri]MCA5004370.1 N-acetyltransferase [Sphingobacterium bovistauri]